MFIIRDVERLNELHMVDKEELKKIKKKKEIKNKIIDNETIIEESEEL